MTRPKPLIEWTLPRSRSRSEHHQGPRSRPLCSHQGALRRWEGFGYWHDRADEPPSILMLYNCWHDWRRFPPLASHADNRAGRDWIARCQRGAAVEVDGRISRCRPGVYLRARVQIQGWHANSLADQPLQRSSDWLASKARPGFLALRFSESSNH